MGIVRALHLSCIAMHNALCKARAPLIPWYVVRWRTLFTSARRLAPVQP